MAGEGFGVKACGATRDGGSDRWMTDPEKSKEERLADALRENLRRRKAQARESEPPPPRED
jgi:hypothetical protein